MSRNDQHSSYPASFEVLNARLEVMKTQSRAFVASLDSACTEVLDEATKAATKNAAEAARKITSVQPTFKFEPSGSCPTPFKFAPVSTETTPTTPTKTGSQPFRFSASSDAAAGAPSPLVPTRLFATAAASWKEQLERHIPTVATASAPSPDASTPAVPTPFAFNVEGATPSESAPFVFGRTMGSSTSKRSGTKPGLKRVATSSDVMPNNGAPWILASRKLKFELQIKASAIANTARELENKITKAKVELEKNTAVFETRTRLATERIEAQEMQVRAEAQAQKLAFEKEAAELRKTHAMDVIRLNVGGHYYTTSSETLLRSDGFLSSMFSGRHTLSPLPDGSLFIDRDGEVFGDILDYLRDGCIDEISDEAWRRRLLNEADFYCVSGLCDLLQGRSYARALSKEDVCFRFNEDATRGMFARYHAGLATEKNSIACGQYFGGVVDLFETVCKSSGELVREAGPNDYPLLLDEYAAHYCRDKIGDRVIVDGLTAFEESFDALFPDILGRLRTVACTNASGWMVAGGAVLRALMRRPVSVLRNPDHIVEESDVDVFLYAKSASKATALARKIWETLAVDGEEWLISRGAYVINMRRRLPNQERWGRATLPIQIILRRYHSPSEVLHGFDVDCSCLGVTSDRTVWALPRAIRALKYGYNVLNPLHAWPNQPTYELRLAKYASRGFTVAVPGLQLAQVDFAHAVSAPLLELRGIARLLFIHAELSSRLVRVKTLSPQSNILPSLSKIFGHHKFYSGYYGDPENQWPENGPPSLPTDYDEHNRILAVWYMVGHVGESGATEEAPNSTSWVLIVPAREVDDWDPVWPFHLPIMDSERRDEHWELICDADRDNLRIPRRLTWDTSPRAREYLNAQEVGLDGTYFSPAYKARAVEARDSTADAGLAGDGLRVRIRTLDDSDDDSATS